jgi:aminoglycoside 2'-N-acetyltransferase I
VQILSFPEAAIPPDLRVQVREIQEQAWLSPQGSLTSADAPSHDPSLQPLSMLLVEEGTVLAALDILSKEIVHAGGRYAAGGLSTVVTRREAGSGLVHLRPPAAGVL